MSIRVVAFGLYGTLLDVESMAELVREYTPMAQALLEAWQTRRLQLTNASTSVARYVDFDRLTFMSLHEIMPRFRLQLTPQDQKKLVDAWAYLHPFPDVAPTLVMLHARALPIAVVTNAVASTARNALLNAGLDPAIRHLVTAEPVKLYKPNVRVYQQLSSMGVEPDEVLYVSAHDWDATGARQAGFHTVFVNRRGGGLAPRTHRTIESLEELSFVLDEPHMTTT